MGNRSKHKRKKKRKRRGKAASPESETDTSQLSPIPLPDDPPQPPVSQVDVMDNSSSVSLLNSTQQSSTSQSEIVPPAESEGVDSVTIEENVDKIDTSDVDPIQSTKMKLLQKISMKQKGQSSQISSVTSEPVLPRTRSLYKAASRTVTNEPKEKGKVQFSLRSSQKVFQANPLSELESETTESVNIDNTATETENKNNMSNVPVQDVASKSEEYYEVVKTPAGFNIDNTVLPEDRIDHKDKEELLQNKPKKDKKEKKEKRESQRRSRRLNRSSETREETYMEQPSIDDGRDEISNSDVKEQGQSINLASETVEEEKQHGRRSSRWSTRSKRLSEDDSKESESSKKSRLRSMRYPESSAVETYEIENVENSPTMYINKDSGEEKIVKPIKIRKRWSLRSQGSVEKKESEHKESLSTEIESKNDEKIQQARDVETLNTDKLSDSKAMSVENVSTSENEKSSNADTQENLEKKNDATNERITRSSRTKSEDEIKFDDSSTKRKTKSEKSKDNDKSDVILSEKTNMDNIETKMESDLLVSKDVGETKVKAVLDDKSVDEKDGPLKMSEIYSEKRGKEESQGMVDTGLKEKVQNDKETEREKAHQKDDKESTEYKTTQDNKDMTTVVASVVSQKDQEKTKLKTVVDDTTKDDYSVKEMDKYQEEKYAPTSDDGNKKYGNPEKDNNKPDRDRSQEKDGSSTKCDKTTYDYDYREKDKTEKHKKKDLSPESHLRSKKFEEDLETERKSERLDDFKEGQRSRTERGDDQRSPEKSKSDKSRHRSHSDKSEDYEDMYRRELDKYKVKHHDSDEKNEDEVSKSTESFSSKLLKEAFKTSNVPSSKAKSSVVIEQDSNKSISNSSKIDNKDASIVDLNLDTLVPQKSKWEEDDSSSDYLDSHSDFRSDSQKRKSGKSRETLEIRPGIEEKKSSFLGIKIVHTKDEKSRESVKTKGDKSKLEGDKYADKKERTKSEPLDPLVNVDSKGAGALKNIMCAYSDSEGEDEKEEQVVQAASTNDKLKHEKEEASGSNRKKYGDEDYRTERSDRKYSEFDKRSSDRSYKTSKSRERSPRDDYGSYKSSDTSDRDRYSDRYGRDEKVRDDGDRYIDRFGRDEKKRDRYGRDEKMREKYEEGYSQRKKSRRIDEDYEKSWKMDDDYEKSRKADDDYEKSRKTDDDYEKSRKKDDDFEKSRKWDDDYEKSRKMDDDYDDGDDWYSDNYKSKKWKERENRSKDRYAGDYDKDYETSRQTKSKHYDYDDSEKTKSNERGNRSKDKYAGDSDKDYKTSRSKYYENDPEERKEIGRKTYDSKRKDDDDDKIDNSQKRYDSNRKEDRPDKSENVGKLHDSNQRPDKVEKIESVSISQDSKSKEINSDKISNVTPDKKSNIISFKVKSRFETTAISEFKMCTSKWDTSDESDNEDSAGIFLKDVGKQKTSVEKERPSRFDRSPEFTVLKETSGSRSRSEETSNYSKEKIKTDGRLNRSRSKETDELWHSAEKHETSSKKKSRKSKSLEKQNERRSEYFEDADTNYEKRKSRSKSRDKDELRHHEETSGKKSKDEKLLSRRSLSQEKVDESDHSEDQDGVYERTDKSNKGRKREKRHSYSDQEKVGDSHIGGISEEKEVSERKDGKKKRNSSGDLSDSNKSESKKHKKKKKKKKSKRKSSEGQDAEIDSFMEVKGKKHKSPDDEKSCHTDHATENIQLKSPSKEKGDAEEKKDIEYKSRHTINESDEKVQKSDISHDKNLEYDEKTSKRDDLFEEYSPSHPLDDEETLITTSKRDDMMEEYSPSHPLDDIKTSKRDDLFEEYSPSHPLDDDFDDYCETKTAKSTSSSLDDQPYDPGSFEANEILKQEQDLETKDLLSKEEKDTTSDKLSTKDINRSEQEGKMIEKMKSEKKARSYHLDESPDRYDSKHKRKSKRDVSQDRDESPDRYDSKHKHKSKRDVSQDRDESPDRYDSKHKHKSKRDVSQDKDTDYHQQNYEKKDRSVNEERHYEKEKSREEAGSVLTDVPALDKSDTAVKGERSEIHKKKNVIDEKVEDDERAEPQLSEKEKSEKYSSKEGEQPLQQGDSQERQSHRELSEERQDKQERSKSRESDYRSNRGTSRESNDKHDRGMSREKDDKPASDRSKGQDARSDRDRSKERDERSARSLSKDQDREHSQERSDRGRSQDKDKSYKKSKSKRRRSSESSESSSYGSSSESDSDHSRTRKSDGKDGYYHSRQRKRSRSKDRDYYRSDRSRRSKSRDKGRYYKPQRYWPRGDNYRSKRFRRSRSRELENIYGPEYWERRRESEKNYRPSRGRTEDYEMGDKKRDNSQDKEATQSGPQITVPLDNIPLPGQIPLPGTSVENVEKTKSSSENIFETSDSKISSANVSEREKTESDSVPKVETVKNTNIDNQTSLLDNTSVSCILSSEKQTTDTSDVEMISETSGENGNVTSATETNVPKSSILGKNVPSLKFALKPKTPIFGKLSNIDIKKPQASSQPQTDSQAGEADGKVYKFSFKKSMAERKLTKPVGMVFGEDTEENVSKDAEKPSQLSKLDPFGKEQNKVGYADPALTKKLDDIKKRSKEVVEKEKSKASRDFSDLVQGSPMVKRRTESSSKSHKDKSTKKSTETEKLSSEIQSKSAPSKDSETKCKEEMEPQKGLPLDIKLSGISSKEDDVIMQSEQQKCLLTDDQTERNEKSKSQIERKTHLPSETQSSDVSEMDHKTSTGTENVLPTEILPHKSARERLQSATEPQKLTSFEIQSTEELKGEKILKLKQQPEFKKDVPSEDPSSSSRNTEIDVTKSSQSSSNKETLPDKNPISFKLTAKIGASLKTEMASGFLETKSKDDSSGLSKKEVIEAVESPQLSCENLISDASNPEQVPPKDMDKSTDQKMSRLSEINQSAEKEKKSDLDTLVEGRTENVMEETELNILAMKKKKEKGYFLGLPLEDEFVSSSQSEASEDNDILPEVNDAKDRSDDLENEKSKVDKHQDQVTSSISPEEKGFTGEKDIGLTTAPTDSFHDNKTVQRSDVIVGKEDKSSSNFKVEECAPEEKKVLDKKRDIVDSTVKEKKATLELSSQPDSVVESGMFSPSGLLTDKVLISEKYHEGNDVEGKSDKFRVINKNLESIRSEESDMRSSESDGESGDLLTLQEKKREILTKLVQEESMKLKSDEVQETDLHDIQGISRRITARHHQQQQGMAIPKVISPIVTEGKVKSRWSDTASASVSIDTTNEIKDQQVTMAEEQKEMTEKKETSSLEKKHEQFILGLTKESSSDKDRKYRDERERDRGDLDGDKYDYREKRKRKDHDYDKYERSSRHGRSRGRSPDRSRDRSRDRSWDRERSRDMKDRDRRKGYDRGYDRGHSSRDKRYDRHYSSRDKDYGDRYRSRRKSKRDDKYYSDEDEYDDRYKDRRKRSHRDSDDDDERHRRDSRRRKSYKDDDSDSESHSEGESRYKKDSKTSHKDDRHGTEQKPAKLVDEWLKFEKEIIVPKPDKPAAAMQGKPNSDYVQKMYDTFFQSGNKNNNNEPFQPYQNFPGMSTAGAPPLTNVGEPVYSQQTTSVLVSQQGQTLLPQPVPGQSELPPPPPSQPMVGQQMYPPSQQPVVSSQVYTQPSQTVPGVPPDQMYVQQPGQVMQGIPQEQQMYIQQNQMPQVSPDQQVYGAPNQMMPNQMFEPPSGQPQANLAQGVAPQVFDPSGQPQQPNQVVPPQMFEQPGQPQGVFPTNQQVFMQQHQPVDQPIMGQHQQQIPVDQPIMGQHQPQMPMDQPIMGQPPMSQMHPLNQNMPQHMLPEQPGPHGFVPPNQQVQNFLPGTPAEMHAFSQQQPKDRFSGGNRQQRFMPGNMPRPGPGMPPGPPKPSMQEQFPDMRRQMPSPRPLMKIQVKPPATLQQSPDSRPSSTTGQKLVRQSSEESQKSDSDWPEKKQTPHARVNKKSEVSSVADSAVGSSDEVVKKDNKKKQIDIEETSSKTLDTDTKKESEKTDTKEPEKSEKPEQQSQVTSSPLPLTQVTGLSIKLRMKQEFQAEKEMDQSTTPPQAQVKPEKVKSRWRRFSELDLTGNSPNADEVPSSTVEDIASEATSDTEDLAATAKEDEKSSKTEESANYDAWDPASDIPVESAPPPPKKEFTKKEKKEKDKEIVQNSDVTSGSAKAETMPTEKVPPPPPPPPKEEEEEEGKPPHFERIEENIYLGERKVSKKMKQVRRMLCDCTTCREDREMGYEACGEDCLNRMLYIECGSRCPCGDYCTNRRFQKRQYSDVEPFQTHWKGFGLKANEALKAGQFIMEYVGEVLDYRQFKSRSKQYAKTGNIHHYFMALNADEVIDATLKGNISRFINHSCDPNSETQKWTVNGTLRVGFFARKDIEPGTELTFDYQFESYGEAQKCFCGASNCRGVIGGVKTQPQQTKKRTLSAEELEKKRQELFEDEGLEEDLEEMSQLEQGLKNKDHVLNICRLMVRAEEVQHRATILNILQKTSENNCLRLFLDYHGLELLWSWLADNREASIDLKIQILSTLKMLPITNKTVLKDSKILSIVERWAADEDNGGQSSPSVSSTPVKDKDVPSILNITKDNKQTKKKVKFADEASSSDNESRTSANDNFSDITGNDLYTDFEGSPNAQSPSKRPDSKSKKDSGVSELCRQVLDKKEPLLETLTKEFSQDSNSEDKGEITPPQTSDSLNSEDSDSNAVQTSADSTDASDNKDNNLETALADSSSKEESQSEDLASLATALLQHWIDLKEIFKIPKKQQVEERKRIERELTSSSNGRRMERFERSQDRYRHRVAGWDTGKKRKRSQPPPPPPSSDDDARKSLLPAPPKMSKQERRELFEAQVKAQDEMIAEQQRQEQEAYLQYQQQVMNDPNYMYYQQDPNCPQMPGMPMHPGMMQTSDMMQPGMEPGMEQQFIDPNMAQQMMNPEQFAMAQHQQQYMEGQQPFIDMSQGQPQPDMFNQQMQGPFVNAQGMTSQGQPIMQPNIQVPQDQVQAMQAPVADAQFYNMPSSQGPLLPQQQQPSQLPLQSNPAVQLNDPQSLAYLQQQMQMQQQLGMQNPLASVGAPAVTTTVISNKASEDEDVPPPPSPPKPKPIKLPPNWKSAKDAEGKVYYYHTSTRQTQWEPPTWDQTDMDDMELGTPGSDDSRKKVTFSTTLSTTTTAAADTSSETAKKLKDQFRNKMSSFVVLCLNPYRKPDCKAGRIVSTEDFKHLARKLTHHVMAKELKHCRHVEDLEVNENVKSKAKDYVKKYMGRFGSLYKKTSSPDI